MLVPPIAQWAWPSRNLGRNRPVSAPPVKEKPVAGRVRDTTLRLAGGDLGDREAKQQVPSHGPYQEPLMTVTTVIAGQVKHKNNRRTTVFSWSTAGVRPRAVMHSRLSTFDFRARLSACAGCVKVVEGERVSCTNIHIGNAVKKHSDTNSGT